MRLNRPFLQLPVRFDPELLVREVQQLPSSAWTPHPQGYLGNDAVVLVSPGGGVNDDMSGPMAPTEYLRSCPYIMEAMAELGGVWGRSRLMGLGAGAEVPIHVDVHYYWRTHLRIHIPVITNPGVRFTCGDETVHMAPGECWVFDSFRRHRVENAGSEKRVHLVLDTVGNERLWELVEAAGSGAKPPTQATRSGDRQASDADLAFEQVNVPAVMSPWEIQCHINYLVEHAVPDPALAPMLNRLNKFIAAWQGAWSRFGTADEGRPTYRKLIEDLRADLPGLGAATIKLRNEELFAYALDALVFWNAIARDPARTAPRSFDDAVAQNQQSHSEGAIEQSYQKRIQRPIFIVSTPRSGSTLLFDTLAQAPGLFSVGGESHGLIEGVPSFSVPAKGWTSNRLTAQDAYPEAVEQLAKGFYQALRDRDGESPSQNVRMLEKTPKNALRVPFFDAIWPDAEYVFLYRDPRQTLSSMIEAWLSGGFRTYPSLPGWQGHPWSLLLIPGWPQLVGAPLPTIVAHQWATTMETLVSDLSRVPKDRVRAVVYDDLLESPQGTLEALATSLDLEWDRKLGPELPISRTTVSRPAREKWKQIGDVIETMLPIAEQADEKARAFIESLHQ